MTIDDIDRTIGRLREAAEQISANLLELEQDSNRALLETADLRGGTATRWAQATASLTQLWQWYSFLNELLDRVAHLRGTRTLPSPSQLVELTALLEGPSIELSNQQVPLQQRALLGSPQVRCTPEELLGRMSAEFDESKTVIATIGEAWDTLIPRVRAARAALDSSAELSRALGDAEPAELDQARRRLTELARSLAKDPLSVSAADVEALEASLQAIQSDLEGVGEVRRDITQLLVDARETLEQLRRVVQDGETTHEEVLIKISSLAVPKPLRLPDALEQQLTDVAELSDQGEWREARAALEQWRIRAVSLLDEAQRIAAENRAPLQTRTQLRGLLDSYQAKATRLRLIEDAELSAIYDEAHETLYTAPTDLVHASELISRYREALGENPPAREVLR